MTSKNHEYLAEADTCAECDSALLVLERHYGESSRELFSTEQVLDDLVRPLKILEIVSYYPNVEAFWLDEFGHTFADDIGDVGRKIGTDPGRLNSLTMHAIETSIPIYQSYKRAFEAQASLKVFMDLVSRQVGAVSMRLLRDLQESLSRGRLDSSKRPGLSGLYSNEFSAAQAHLDEAFESLLITNSFPIDERDVLMEMASQELGRGPDQIFLDFMNNPYKPLFLLQLIEGWKVGRYCPPCRASSTLPEYLGHLVTDHCKADVHTFKQDVWRHAKRDWKYFDLDEDTFFDFLLLSKDKLSLRDWIAELLLPHELNITKVRVLKHSKKPYFPWVKLVENLNKHKIPKENYTQFLKVVRQRFGINSATLVTGTVFIFFSTQQIELFATKLQSNAEYSTI